MDDFTRKLLESTKARQESLNKKMTATPQPLPRKRRSPLNDNVHSLEFDIGQPNTDLKKQRPSDEFLHPGDQDPEAKENAHEPVTQPEPEPKSPVKSRFGRLVALAADINNWEDEDTTIRSSRSAKTPSTGNSSSSGSSSAAFRFPSTSSSGSSASKTPTCGSGHGASVKQRSPAKQPSPPRAPVKQPSPAKTPVNRQSPAKTPGKTVSTTPAKANRDKNIAWDQAVMSTLQAQGFVQSPSKARLLYSYKEEEMRAWKKVQAQDEDSSSDSESPKALVSPPKIQPQRSVKEMAKKFNGPPKPKGPDPAELPLSARVALFEKEAAASSAAASATKTLFSKAPSSSKLMPAVQPPTPKQSAFPKPAPVTSTAKSPTRNIAALAKAGSISTVKSPSPSKAAPQTVATQRELFERAQNNWRDNDIIHKAKAERETEMKALLQRWNHRDSEYSSSAPVAAEPPKPATTSPKKKIFKTKSCTPPKAPPLPPPLPGSSQKSTAKLYPELPMPSDESDDEEEEEQEESSEEDDEEAVQQLDELLEEVAQEQESDESEKEEEEVADMTDYESSILQAAIKKVPSLKRTPPPKPPHLPQFHRTEPSAIDPELLHTVSFYRREKDKIKVTPHRTVVRREVTSPPSPKMDTTVKQKQVQSTIRFLQEEAGRQQAIAYQASQALFVCHSSPEFYGSPEQVEGERLLLIATHKQQACLNEILRLKTESALTEPEGTGASASSGTLSIADIRLPLKREFLVHVTENRNVDTVHHFIILVKHRGKVIATQMLSTADGVSAGYLSFNHLIKIDDLTHDFNVLLEVYALQVARPQNGHDRKVLKKDKSKMSLTPKKKKDTKTPTMQSPAGNGGVKTSSFGLVGFALINIKTLHRKSWNLEKVPYVSPLEGNINMKISCDTDFNIHLQNFLTMFEDVSGFGAWHRRWFVLSSRYISYWTYPEDENKKVPLGQIDLRECITPKVALAPRDICARPHTFLMNTVRPAKQGDRESLVVQNHNAFTSTKIMLSADTKEERIVWSTSLNQVLENLRTWDPDALKPMPTPFSDTEC